jgi:hypothetical protein
MPHKKYFFAPFPLPYHSSLSLRITMHIHPISLSLPLLGLLAMAEPGFAADDVVPADSVMGRATADTQRVLLAPLESSGDVQKGGWQLNRLAVEAVTTPAAKVGSSALELRGDAAVAGAKGDFTLWNEVPGECRALGLWVHLPDGANVDKVGLQLVDNEGESLLATVPANWTGWKWLEWDWQTARPAQAYEQKDKNSKLDGPIKSVHLAWFSKTPGRSALAIDGLIATTTATEKPQLSVQVGLNGADYGETNTALSSLVVLTNYSAQAQPARLEWSLQRRGTLSEATPPDPIYGSDHALGAKSWTEHDGKTVETGSLTDGKDWTQAKLPWKSAAYNEATQTIDLGQVRRVTRLAFQAGDANWVRRLDIAASADGQNYQPVEGMQNLDLQSKWGRQTLAVPQAFSARFLRLRYHNNGAKTDSIAMPSGFSVYDGAADENWELPAGGEVLSSGTRTVPLEPRSFHTLSVGSDKPLAPGAYLLALKVQAAGQNQIVQRNVFIMPPPLAQLSTQSRFGLNTAQVDFAPLHRRLGIGWVRFENMKWPMMSPAPNVVKFDGTVAPWVVNHDAIVAGYRAQGLNVLPFLFQTPEYASSAPANVPGHRKLSYPPRDNAEMAQWVFQTVARYGSKTHPATQLQSSDKKSGLNSINVYEIWNEPNLQAESWGPWVGTDAQYMEMYRPAAEAVKRADPTARVTNGGYAGIDVETVDKLRSHTYADGKRPLDFVDILNVHYYSGQTAPEIATVDTNVDRSGSKEGARTYEMALRRLLNWRDKHKPGMPIWLTETGYDTAGPYGIPENLQAARLPRVIMLSLANGMEKVIVYRESGSTPGQHAASGVMREDGSLKPSWFSYATLIRELDGVSGGQRLPHPDANVRLYAWKKGNETILSAWTVSDSGKLGLNLGNGSITDAFGHRRQMAIGNDFALSEFPVYLRGYANAAPINALQQQQRQQQVKEQQESARLAKLKTYLFDFGGANHVGTLELGETRNFTSVSARNVYEEAKGYGFQPASTQDNDAAWINDPLERDSSRIAPGITFRFRVAPGRYTLRTSINAFSGDQALIIRGAAGGEKRLTLVKEGPPVETTLEAGNEVLSIESAGYADIRWMTLIENSPTAATEK